MEQPELGKKIQELRKLKGLTQEELVERCNINVRTIQRIESGEVSPRSFTIKTILEVLGEDSKAFFKNAILKMSNSERTKLQISWMAGILFVVFSTIGIILESFTKDGIGLADSELIIWTLNGFLILGAVVFFLRGYKALGEHFKNKYLSIGTYLYFISEVLFVITAILSKMKFLGDWDTELIFGISTLVLIGLSEIVLGIGILKLQDQFGVFAKIIGILKIIIGGMFLTIILSVIAIFLVLPVLLAEVLFLLRASQKLTEDYS